MKMKASSPLFVASLFLLVLVVVDHHVVLVEAKLGAARHKHIPTQEQLLQKQQEQAAYHGGGGGGGNARSINTDDETIKKKLAEAEEEAKKTASSRQGQQDGSGSSKSGLTSEDVLTFISGQTCPERVYADVVIVGAGVAGIQAAATLEQHGVSYVLLESTHRVGGRVRSHTMRNGITVEDGANWIYELDKETNNPIWQMAQQLGLVAPFHDVENVAIYDENGWPINQDLYQEEVKRFTKAWEKVEKEADNQWDTNHVTYVDTGIQSMLMAEGGWQIGNDSLGNLQHTIQWEMLDWEYAESDTSVRYFPYEIWPVNGHVADSRGFEIIPQTMFALGVKNPRALKTNTRVRSIHYNEWELGPAGHGSSDQKHYRARVETLDIYGCTTSYLGQRVISTVSAGVLTNNLIDFQPPLQYGHEINPHYMTQYIKIFYQFSTKFWDSNAEFIRVVRPLAKRGHCHHWQSMDVPGKFFEGSAVIRCEIMTEVYTSLLDDDGYLTQATLLELLDPLRIVYGPDVVGTPLDIYYAPLNKDINFGYGAYANWRKGHTFMDFAHYYGGTPLTQDCDHNGCNDVNEWILILSGSASCYDYAETVHGAAFAGEKAANIALRQLGYSIAPDTSPCDTNWQWLM